MKKFALLLLMFSFSVFSQEKKNPMPASQIDIAADAFAGRDNFGDSYFIKDNVFIKTDGRTSLEYRKLSIGKIARADIENPLMIVLFYESFNTIVLLDNQLNEIREINFAKLNIPIVAQAAGIASLNRIWVYDSLTQQIGLFDYNSNTYQPVSTPMKENPKYYQTDLNYFQWVDAQQQRYACDVFGKVTSLGKMEHFDRVRFLSGNTYLYATDGQLLCRDTSKNTVSQIMTLDKSFKNFYYKDQILAIFTTTGITNYKIILP